MRFLIILLAATLLSACDGGQTEYKSKQPVVDPKSPEAAISVLHQYFDAINAQGFVTAYQLLDDPQEPLGSLALRYDDTRHVEITFTGKPKSEGAAGNLYLTVPIKVSTTLKDGSVHLASGEAVLHRVNDVPGASQKQLTWHIKKLQLAPQQ
ncbi:hypothetical protein [Gallaecimonas mangrovi]|uniref:hypothetical protein n=1 Tax=Gallaecimonas mangrovi TaxID=2291597 RepID=UPI000E20A190|nr:hypothetical protein [Gallaecimonas mangrovi]